MISRCALLGVASLKRKCIESTRYEIKLLTLSSKNKERRLLAWRSN